MPHQLLPRPHSPRAAREGPPRSAPARRRPPAPEATPAVQRAAQQAVLAVPLPLRRGGGRKGLGWTSQLVRAWGVQLRPALAQAGVGKPAVKEIRLLLGHVAQPPRQARCGPPAWAQGAPPAGQVCPSTSIERPSHPMDRQRLQGPSHTRARSRPVPG
jgi:hypothetical protein